MRDDADIVIVGAGSAGCALAARLSEDPGLRVLLVEAGSASLDPWLRIPIGYFKTVGHPRHDWRFETAPDPEMDGRRLPWPRGKGLGGSSLINGMLYLRGHRRDYDQWAELGNPGWDWDSVRPYFERAMHPEGRARASDGRGGPLSVADLPPDSLSDAFIAAAAARGIPGTDDFNGGDNHGAGYLRMTLRNGQRMSSARAYLASARKRPNLRILEGARTLRVLCEGGRARGVEVLHEGRRRLLHASAEVVLCAGAVQSPQLLQLSGIGPAEQLRHHGIAVALDLPGVGANLQDHLQVRPAFRCHGALTLNDIANSRLRGAREFLRYVFTRGGALRNGVYRAGAFLPVEGGADWPDVQVHFGLVSFDRPHQPPHPFSGITLSACLLRPHSRGRIGLASSDPLAAPRIEAGYLSDEADRRLAVAAVHAMREIAGAAPLAGHIAAEHEPGPAVRSDAELLQWVRRRAGSIFHPVGTCAMGPESDPMAVLDARLRVRGIEGLRVVDGSAMPRIVSGNTNAPIIMMAERAADLMREDLGMRA
ncbi:GMC family oxidoreductase N-terminal domain-containing protein [Variovorax sp.]|jgi:choline dehydrogenase|uniref:GMC family oxidoreductase n=1 Tax=Variovorax sp. TaxID=1871043 RepID=UPI000C5CC687|nr:GMC family oxidoreductase N-terminal domain-containing protein [Variovorax sp.]MBS80901.1 choline dehydrogenase [Variovorax sp.]